MSLLYAMLRTSDARTDIIYFCKASVGPNETLPFNPSVTIVILVKGFF